MRTRNIESLECRRLLSGTAGIWGTVYNDANGNGTREASTEAGLASVRVFIDANGDGKWQSTETSAVTNGYGTYLFQNLAAGSYKLGEVVPTGYKQTKPIGDATVSAVAGQTLHTADFGNAKIATATGSIWGTVFSDANGNGVRDSGEAAQANWRVFLDTNGNNVWESNEPSVLSNAYGTYLFSNVPAGTVRVTEVLPSGWKLTAPAGGYISASVLAGQTRNVGNFGNALATVAQGLNVSLGHFTLAHNTSGTFQIRSTDTRNAAGDDIEGMTFTLQIGAGTGTTPSITSVDLTTGTIWAGHNASIQPVSGGVQAQYVTYSVSTGAAGDFVNANGLLATVTLNAAGAAPGDYAIRMIATKYPGFDSAFLNGVGDPVSATFVTGTLTIT